MGCLTILYKYLMWELNISLRLFSVGDQGKNNGWWMLPEIQEIHSNKWKIFLTLRIEADCSHRWWSFHYWRYPNSKWTQSWLTALGGSEWWGLNFCPSNSVSSHLAKLLITELLWQAPFVGVLGFCSHLSFFYRAFSYTSMHMAFNNKWMLPGLSSEGNSLLWLLLSLKPFVYAWRNYFH